MSWKNRSPTKNSQPPAFCGLPSGRFTTFAPKKAPSRAYGSTGTSDDPASCVDDAAAGVAGAGADGNAAGLSLTVLLSTSATFFSPPASTTTCLLFGSEK